MTPFYNLAMPLIRYELGDYGVLSPEPCGCGRTLPVLERILGRTRNIFRFVDGTSTWPVLLSREFQAFVPNRQFQVVQLTHTDIEFRYVPAADDQVNDPAGADRLSASPSCTHRSRSALAAAAAIPRSSGGKYEDCMSLVGVTQERPAGDLASGVAVAEPLIRTCPPGTTARRAVDWRSGRDRPGRCESIRIVLAMAPDERLVLAREIELEADQRRARRDPR